MSEVNWVQYTPTGKNKNKNKWKGKKKAQSLVLLPILCTYVVYQVTHWPYDP
jgi:hypothetical protein